MSLVRELQDCSCCQLWAATSRQVCSDCHIRDWMSLIRCRGQLAGQCVSDCGVFVSSFLCCAVLCCGRPLYAKDGHWAMDHIGNWQHALMYAGVAVSGVVDLIGFYTPLPAGTEQVRGECRRQRFIGRVCRTTVALPSGLSCVSLLRCVPLTPLTPLWLSK
jgi:hypothetical protein